MKKVDQSKSLVKRRWSGNVEKMNVAQMFKVASEQGEHKYNGRLEIGWKG